MWRIHQRMGMGGDQLVADLPGDDVEHDLGEDIRGAEGPLSMKNGLGVNNGSGSAGQGPRAR